jgi:putative addiction module component (TIGR02574 family)
VTIDQLEAAALTLSESERIRLVQRLIASLDANAAIDHRWYDEAERRLAAMTAGTLPEMPADAILAEMGLPPLR